MSEEEIKTELKQIRTALELLSKTLTALLYQFIGKSEDDDGDDTDTSMLDKNKLTKAPPDNFHMRSYIG